MKSLIVLLLLTQVANKDYKVTLLNTSLEPLRTQFNADVGKPRLVALLSPT